MKANVAAYNEKTLYEIVKALSLSDIPIMFKGAIITKIVLSEKHYTETERGTKDIDANWINGYPQPENIANSITSAMQAYGLDYTAVMHRPYGEHKSAGIYIYKSGTNELVTKMDIDVKPLPEYKIYHYGEAEFYGASVDQILADKISSLSTNSIFRRSKDLVDIYALSRCSELLTNKIYDIIQESGKKLGDFDAFRNRTSELRHAYESLHGIINKPEFDKIYKAVNEFAQPFIERRNQLIWIPDYNEWDNAIQYKNEIIKNYGEKYADGLFDQKQKFICLAGIPGAGKEKKAKEISENMTNAVIVRTNDIREKYSNFDNKQIFDEAYEEILKSLNNGQNVIFVATNLDVATRKKVLGLVEGNPNIQKELIVLYKSVDCCLSDKEQRILKNKAIKLHNNPPAKAENWDNVQIIGKDPYRGIGFIEEKSFVNTERTIEDEWSL